VIAQYRDTSDDPAAIKTIGEVDARSYAWMAKFFKLGAAAGVLATNTADSRFGVAFDYFKIEASAAPAQQAAPDLRGQEIFLPLIRR
jgi:hypothetical protein